MDAQVQSCCKEIQSDQKKEFLRLAREEEETLYPSIPKGEFDKVLWNRLVVTELGPEKKFNNPYFVSKADF